MRAQGKFANHEIRHLTTDQTRHFLENKHKELYKQHGPGVFNAQPLDREGAIEWTYDYAATMDPKTGIVTQDEEPDERFGTGPSVDAGFVAYLRRASVFIKNAGNIHAVPDGNHPSGSRFVVTSEDEDLSASERADVVNFLDAVVSAFDEGRDHVGYAELSDIDGLQGERLRPVDPANEERIAGGTGEADEAGVVREEGHSTQVGETELAE